MIWEDYKIGIGNKDLPDGWLSLIAVVFVSKEGSLNDKGPVLITKTDFWEVWSKPWNGVEVIFVENCESMEGEDKLVVESKEMIIPTVLKPFFYNIIHHYEDLHSCWTTINCFFWDVVVIREHFWVG